MHPRAVLTAATRADLEARPEMLLLPEYEYLVRDLPSPAPRTIRFPDAPADTALASAVVVDHEDGGSAVRGARPERGDVGPEARIDAKVRSRPPRPARCAAIRARRLGPWGPPGIDDPGRVEDPGALGEAGAALDVAAAAPRAAFPGAGRSHAGGSDA